MYRFVLKETFEGAAMELCPFDAILDGRSLKRGDLKVLVKFLRDGRVDRGRENSDRGFPEVSSRGWELVMCCVGCNP
ncbi:MAG: hypothetical protein JXA22_00890 [Candidatus Thermoplasmatota archaeon]|nr:hypothetical protein [Candidatus Thermoplasmatota archaeon]